MTKPVATMQGVSRPRSAEAAPSRLDPPGARVGTCAAQGNEPRTVRAGPDTPGGRGSPRADSRGRAGATGRWPRMHRACGQGFAGASALALLAMVAIDPASAAQPDDRVQAGPRICLALSGGGARGAAHIGVLKVLEELRVPVHCIAGTSMGALVGGAYASGMSIEEMGRLTRAITTELLVNEHPPREERSMRRKRDDYEGYFGPDIGVAAGGLRLPKGLVSGVQVAAVLRGLARVRGVHAFDRLPIPFRAVATDLVTGKPVVFDRGELSNVMRASMSVPGAVAPAEFDGKMLVDGMLTQNLPVETARAMGADVIIAVNVGTPLLRREQLNGILGVTGQMLSILTEQNVQRSLAALRPDDILIEPDLGTFATSDFDDLPRIAPLGETAARKLADRLKTLALPPSEYAALRATQRVQVAPDLRPVDEVRFGPLAHVNPHTLRAAMDTRPGEALDQTRLDRDMRRLYGTGDFEHVNYAFLEEPNRRVLVVDAIEKSWGRDHLRFGLGLASDFGGDAYFNAVASFRRNWINPLGAEWRTTLQAGRTTRFATEFYQPVRAEGDLFVVPSLVAERRSVNIYQGRSSIATYDIASATLGLEAGTLLGRYGEARLGLVRGTMDPTLDTGPAWLQPAAGRVPQGALTARILLDRLDSVHFPREGWQAGLRIHDAREGLGADYGYTKWQTDGSLAYSLGNHTINLGWKFGGRLGGDPLPRYDQFHWGGFLQQSGYATGQLIGEKLAFGRAMYYHRILRGTLFEGAYGGFSLELGRLENPLVPGSPSGTLRSASVFVAADTPLGPAYLGYGHARDGQSGWYFFLGRPY